MKVRTISPIQTPKQIMLCLNHELKNISHYYTKKIMQYFDLRYIHITYAQRNILFQ